MSFGEILNTLFLKPIQLVFEVVYMMAYRVIDSPGLSIIVLSVFMNFLVLPLYMRADAIQEEEHEIERKLQRGVEHIKKTFNGDERMMLLQTYCGVSFSFKFTAFNWSFFWTDSRFEQSGWVVAD